MPRLAYRAKDLSGKAVEGSVRARDERQARLTLSERGLEVLSLESAAGAKPERRAEAGRPEAPASTGMTLFKPVSTRQLRSMTAQLALMLETGTPLAQSLTALSEQMADEPLGGLLGEVHQAVTGGSTLSEALGAHPRVFGQFYVSAVRAGETSGKLTEVFARLELSMGKREELLSRLRAALTYPIILTVMATLAVIFLVSFVLPKFRTVFASSGAELPLPTRGLLAGTGLLQEYWYLAIPLFLGPPIALLLYFSSRPGRPAWDRLALRLPVLGPLTHTVQTASLLRILGTLLGSGVPLVESLKVAVDSCTNVYFRQAVQRMSSGVLQGERLSANFSRSDLFSPPVKQMISTGEKSGRLAYVMNRMSDYLDDLARAQMQKLSALFEPAVIVVMGVIIGYIAVSLMLPLFRMSSVIGQGG